MMVGLMKIDYNQALKDIYEGVVTGLALSFIIINLHLPEKIMDYIRDIETSSQAQKMLKMLDNKKGEIGHVYGEELGWNCEAC